MAEIEPPALLKTLVNACLHLSDEEWARLLIRSLSERDMMELLSYAVLLQQRELATKH